MKLWKVAAIAALLLTLAVSVAAPVFAQDATPTAGDATPVAVPDLQLYVVGDLVTIPAESCTTQEVTVEEMSAIASTPVALAERVVTNDGILAISAVGASSAQTVDGVMNVLAQFIACNNAGNRAAVVGLFTPGGQQSWLGIAADVGDAAARNGLIAAGLTASDPRPSDQLAGIDGVLNVVDLADGRVAALVLNTDPRVADGDQVIDLFILVDQGGTYMIDEFIQDPFDLTSGYGFEKS